MHLTRAGSMFSGDFAGLLLCIAGLESLGTVETSTSSTEDPQQEVTLAPI